ncbi:MAG: hypothetical protein J2O47_03915 [Acidimicrobiaceae bacterium]|nr:hypothetical protein [Acidimicrobiaceae bacterium]
MADDGKALHSQSITAEGLAYIERARQRRADRGLRRRSCRNQVLHWVDTSVNSTSDLVDASLFFGSNHAWFEGAIFDVDEQADAINYLVDQDLMRGGIGAWGAPTFVKVGITHRGQECVTDFDSDVGAYLSAKQRSGTHITIQGEGHTLALALGANSTANASSVNVDAAVLLARAVREASDVLSLGPEAQRALADIEQREDAGRVKRGLQWLGHFATDAGSSALGSVIGSVALRLLAGG